MNSINNRIARLIQENAAAANALQSALTDLATRENDPNFQNAISLHQSGYRAFNPVLSVDPGEVAVIRYPARSYSWKVYRPHPDEGGTEAGYTLVSNTTVREEDEEVRTFLGDQNESLLSSPKVLQHLKHLTEELS